jgi:hypothetical protein
LQVNSNNNPASLSCCYTQYHPHFPFSLLIQDSFYQCTLSECKYVLYSCICSKTLMCNLSNRVMTVVNYFRTFFAFMQPHAENHDSNCVCDIQQLFEGAWTGADGSCCGSAFKTSSRSLPCWYHGLCSGTYYLGRWLQVFLMPHFARYHSHFVLVGLVACLVGGYFFAQSTSASAQSLSTAASSPQFLFRFPSSGRGFCAGIILLVVHTHLQDVTSAVFFVTLFQRCCQVWQDCITTYR